MARAKSVYGESVLTLFDQLPDAQYTALHQLPNRCANSGVDIDVFDGHCVDPAPSRRWLAFLSDVQAVIERGRCTLDAADRLGRQAIELKFPKPATAEKATKLAAGFIRHARAHGIEWLDEIDTDLVTEYLWTASRHRGSFTDVTAMTAANRQWAVGILFEALADQGLWTGNPPTGPRIERNPSDNSSRPLTAAELHRVRIYSAGGLFVTREPLLVALAEAGADALETALAHADDIDLDTRQVQLRGPCTRVNDLSDWATETFTEYFTDSNPAGPGPLCVTDAARPSAAAHSVTVRLGRILSDAGLGRTPNVTARSIRLCAAERVRAEHGLEAAARFLGNQSLDLTAAALRYDWQNQA